MILSPNTVRMAGAPQGDRSSHRWPLPKGRPPMGGPAKTAGPFCLCSQSLEDPLLLKLDHQRAGIRLSFLGVPEQTRQGITEVDEGAALVPQAAHLPVGDPCPPELLLEVISFHLVQAVDEDCDPVRWGSPGEEGLDQRLSCQSGGSLGPG